MCVCEYVGADLPICPVTLTIIVRDLLLVVGRRQNSPTHQIRE